VAHSTLRATRRCQSPLAPGGGSGTVGLVATPEPSPAEGRAWCHGTRGEGKALPHWEVGLEPHDTWRHWSPRLPGGRAGATRHVVMPEPSHTGRRVWNCGTCGDTRALPHREVGPVPHDTWRRRSHPVPGAASGAIGLEEKFIFTRISLIQRFSFLSHS
jgi:hypothetical protein